MEDIRKLNFVMKGKILLIDHFSKGHSICKECAAYKSRPICLSRVQKFKKSIKAHQACKICGEEDSRLLEFAHYKREDKNVGLSRSFSISQIKKELDKGRLLCIWCHRLETLEENETLSHKRDKNYIYSLEENMLLDELAIPCHGPSCLGKMRHSSFFYRRKSGKLRKKCKKCSCLHFRENCKKKKEFVHSVKLNIGHCQMCKMAVTKETCCCFDFDHLDRSTKITTISNMVRKNRSIAIIEAEIEKCRLLCCKCHILHTWEQMNYEESIENSCIDCFKVIQKVAVRCAECNDPFVERGKKKIATQRKMYWSTFKPKKIRQCVDCGCQVSQKARRCRKCYIKSVKSH